MASCFIDGRSEIWESRQEVNLKAWSGSASACLRSFSRELAGEVPAHALPPKALNPKP